MVKGYVRKTKEDPIGEICGEFLFNLETKSTGSRIRETDIQKMMRDGTNIKG